MSIEQTTEILGAGLPTAEEVELYTEDQMRELATLWSYKLRSTKESGMHCSDWLRQLSKPKFNQFTMYVIKSVQFNNLPEWRKQANFLLKEVPQ